MTNRIDFQNEVLPEQLQKGKDLTPRIVLELPKEPDGLVMCADCREVRNQAKFDKCICGGTAIC